MKTKLFGALAVLLALTLIMAGCSGSSSAPSSAASGASAPAESSSAPAASEPKVDFPKGPVTIIVPSAPGGGQDISVRIIAKYLEKHLGTTTVVENVEEGSGLTALLEVAKGKSDGYTLITATCVGYLGAPQQQDVGFNPLTDMITLASQGTVPMIIAASPHAPAKTADDFISYAKAHPGELSIAVSGVVNIAPMAAASSFNALGLELKFVPTNGAAESVALALGDHTEYCIAPASTLSSHVQEGTLTPLYDTGSLDENIFNVPNIAALGHPEAALPYFRVIGCRSGTPDAVVDILRKAITDTLNDPECQAAMEKANDPLMGVITDPAKLQPLLESNYKSYGELMKQLTLGQ